MEQCDVGIDGHREEKEEGRRSGKERKMSIFSKIWNIDCESYMTVHEL